MNMEICMIRYLKWKYKEWCINNEENLMTISIRPEFYGKDKSKGFDRHAAIVHVIDQLMLFGVINRVHAITICDDGTYVMFHAKRKYWSIVQSIQEKVR
jgi:hypothetical protein